MAQKQKTTHKKQHIPAATLKFAAEVSFVLQRQWFESDFSPPLDHRMASLMFYIFVSAQKNLIHGKNAAAGIFGTADRKTARKYIARAIELGFFDVVKSDEDRRVEYLYPTKLLNELIQKEIDTIILTRD